MNDWVHDIRTFLSGEITTDEKTRRGASRDASLFEVTPQFVVYPADVSDIKNLVRYAADHPRLTLTARSGGTGMDGGALNTSAIVDFTKYFTKIGKITGDTGVVEPGVFYRDFEKETKKQNRIMPSYPASREICTVGGMVANNSGGELTLRYGKTDQYVKKLKVVLADGNEYTIGPLSKSEFEQKRTQSNFEGITYRDLARLIEQNRETIKGARPLVSKNSAGYALWDVWNEDTGIFDLTKLFVGAQGTLGLITEITFGLVEPKPQNQMVVVFLDNIEKLGELVEVVLSHEPTTFESYDDKTLRLAVKFFFEFVRRLGLKNIFSMAYHTFPEALSVLFRGFPKLVLQITFEGDDKEMLRMQGERLKADLKQFNPRRVEVVRSAVEVDEYWMVRRESFNLLRHKVRGMKTAPFVDDVCVRPEVLPQFLPRLEAIFKPYEHLMVYNIAGHMGNGNFHIIPLMDFENAQARDVIFTIAEKVYALVGEYGGSITGEHNDGIMRTPYLGSMFDDEVLKLFAETKKIFDPKNIFNPGKKVGGSLDTAKAYLKRKND